MKHHKSPKQDPYSIFLSVGFLLGMTLLFLNDFVLKETLHNWWTGKLSDFSGLFVFALFWSALFPKRVKLVHLSIALFFVFWKSPFSQTLIDTINRITYLNYGRVIDWTDLLALLVLPFSYFYQKTFFRKVSKSIPKIISMLLASFLFVATSVEDVSDAIILDESYLLTFPQDSLFVRLNRIDSVKVLGSDTTQQAFTSFNVSFYSFNCKHRMFSASSSESLSDTTCRLSFLRVFELENCYKVPDPDLVEQSIQNLRDELKAEIIDKL